MIISNSQVGMSSKRQYNSTSYAHTNLQSWGNSGFKSVDLVDSNFSSTNSSFGEAENTDTKSNLSFSGSMDGMLKKLMEAQSIKNDMNAEKQNNTRVQFVSLNYLLHWLFGKKYNTDSEFFSALESSGIGLTDQRDGGCYNYEEYYYEQESTSFSTKGTVITEDGREISFNVNLTMTRAFEQSYSEAASWGAALNTNLCDPLVINLKGSVSDISDQNFIFDIDADGITEKIKMPTNGSGFLALDKNGDGVINDGSELFGAQSQDGFADLAAYDEDGNGWIDEADSVFRRLMIYSKDSNGNDKLVAIGEAGVGAIYLGNTETEFSKNGSMNETNAVIRKTGIFLYENGQAGTIQHVDFAKQA